MLQIKNVSKTYRTGALTQRALADVSLSLRDNEFVAILGASGSGKTTLLNVIGGLDRYDEGDLIINGKSTKKYKSRDWDAYRNHSVGFVFQSYNLIPHQSVLANVELALTIGGVSKKERTERAREALGKVGLSEHIHKKPSQLSGGQMQRVAIARALVNDPDILLADEPTGALDSETSIQVMDLLKEVAADRLVVMVTHNPELAEKYATRIVRLKDGKIVADSDPYEPEGDVPATHKAGRSSMSFLTALNLSLKNLWTKKVRTLLVAFAGSIGIIGIAMILSMSHGANVYIGNIQEETLKSYPLQITRTSFNLANMMSPQGRPEGVPDEAEVREWRAVTTLFSHVATNDLESLADYIENGGTKIYDHVQAIEYDFNVTPQIYKINGDTYRQVNPDRTFSSLGFSATDTMSSLMTSFSSTSSFYAMPSDPDLYVGGFDVKAGRWPENPNECVLVLSENGYIADLTLYTLGIKDPADLDEMIKAFAEGYAANVDDTTRTYRYEEFLGITFKLVSAADRYVRDEEHGIWTDRSGDEAFMKSLIKSGEDLTVVGVVQPNEENDNPTMNVGIAYPASLTLHVIDLAKDSDIVKAQIEDPDVDVFTGVPFGEQAAREGLDLSTLFTVDEDALKKVFNVDPSALTLPFDPSALDLSSLDLSSVFDPSSFASLSPDLSGIDVASLLSKIKIDATREDAEELLNKLVAGFAESVKDDPAADPSRLGESFSEYLASDAAREALTESVYRAFEENGAGVITFDDLSATTEEIMAGFPEYAESRAGEDAPIAEILADYLSGDDVREMISSAADEYRAKIRGFVINEEQAKEIASSLFTSYEAYAKENALTDPESVAEAFTEYLGSGGAKKIISDAASKVIDTSELERAISDEIAKYSSSAAPMIQEAAESAAKEIMTKISGAITGALESAAGDALSSFGGAFSFDPEALSSAFKINMTPEELRDMMTSLLSTDVGSYDTNLKKLGYADTKNPSTITIYPADFNGKTEIKKIIEDYNDRMKAEGLDDKVIVYTDIVDTLMSSVTDIIDAISYILIAFVAISLVVSSVMIGVITYISVLERKKEIGILRAIGASRRNVSNVFNAETFIIGALAGVLGILITLVLLIPSNYAIHALSGQQDINAILPPAAAVLLILLSIALTLIGGIIPSRKAAKSDPVEALRSE